MSYPTALDTDTTPGVSIYPPQSTQSPGSLSTAPVGAASPTLSQWLQRVADSLVGIETQLGLPSSPAAGSILNILATKIAEAPLDGRIYGRQSGVWAQVPTQAARSILQLFILGDSYSDSGNSNILSSGNNTSWPSFLSDGPTWSWLIATLLGLPVNPRTSNASPIGTNYAVSGSDANTGPLWGTQTYSLTDQITSFLADYGNTIPAGAGIVIWDGINDVQAATGTFAGTQSRIAQGMPNSSDPVTTLSADFVQPAVNSTVAITVGSTANFALFSPQKLMIGNSVYQVSSITDGTHAVVINQNNFSNPAAGAPVAPGATVSSSGGTLPVRWTGAAYVDMIVPVIAAQVQRLVTAGATNIVYVNCPDISLAPSQAGKPSIATINYFNTKLAAALGSISQVTLCNIFNLWSQIEANPNAYGIRVLDSNSQAHTVEPPRDFLWWDVTHPSSSTHGFIASTILNLLASVYGNSVQMANAVSGIGNIWPNGIPAAWTPSATQPYSNFVLSSDPRMDYADVVRIPGKYVRFFEDYDKLNVTPPEYAWVTLAAGGGATTGSNSQGGQPFGMDGFYICQVTAVNDAFGQQCTSKPVKTQVGSLDLSWRIYFNQGGGGQGDTLMAKFGLVDSLSTLANGLFWIVQNAGGTVTASFNSVVAGALTAYTLPVSGITLAAANTFRAVADYENVRWSFYINGTFVGLNKFASVPTVNILPFHQGTKVAGTILCQLQIDFASFVWRLNRGT